MIVHVSNPPSVAGVIVEFSCRYGSACQIRGTPTTIPYEGIVIGSPYIPPGLPVGISGIWVTESGRAEGWCQGYPCGSIRGLYIVRPVRWPIERRSRFNFDACIIVLQNGHITIALLRHSYGAPLAHTYPVARQKSTIAATGDTSAIWQAGYPNILTIPGTPITMSEVKCLNDSSIMRSN